MRAAWNDHANHDEKVRRLFDDFDIRKVRSLDMETFVAGFRRLNVGFSSATVQDLFEKADTNQDRVVSLGEFQRFGEMYPTMVDCVYYRAKDYWTEVAQKDAVEEAKRLLDELRSREAAARAAHAAAQQETDAADHKLQTQVQIVADAQSREVAAKAALEAAHDDTERARAELRERMAELNRAKDRERQKQVELAEAQRAVEVAARRMQSQDAEVAKAEERLREIERLLAEQHREVDLQRQAAERCRGELATAQSREQDAVLAENEARRDVHVAADRAADAEAEVASRQERERAAAAALRDAANDVARQLAQRDADQRDLLAAKEREAQRKVDEVNAGQAVDSQERNVAQLEQENVDFNARRRQVDDEEKPLMEQEVRLREQRDSLESKEMKLRTDFQSFTGRGARPASPKLAVAAAPAVVAPAATTAAATYTAAPAPSSLAALPPASPVPQSAAAAASLAAAQAQAAA
eukprot:Rhum_TRINITY_DN14572_c1_g1::Rhum_TRINITY_DN14572_c1_g1_i1::g.97897::m.97897